MEPSEIFTWLSGKLRLIQNYPTRIKEIKIFNRTEVHFGKKYYRIYFIIETDAIPIFKPRDKMTDQEKEETKLFEYEMYYPNHIAFYEHYFHEKVVENNYDWIVSIFNVFIDHSTFKCDIQRYKSD